METEVLDNFTAISFLVNDNGFCAKPILLKNVSWREYECFLREFQDKAGWRLAYDTGALEFKPPLAEHEKPSRSVDRFVWSYCDFFDLTVESLDSTTYRRKLRKKGVEPDAYFYVQTAAKIIGKTKQLKPESYPVPDVAVEIDVTHGSLDKFKIYAALKVPELWLKNGKNIVFYQLVAGKYNQSETSLALPRLTSTVLSEFIKLSQTDGQTAALKAFRRWLSEQKQ